LVTIVPAARRVGVIALLTIALLSLAVLSFYREKSKARLLYAGEDAYAALLVTARYSCARRADFGAAVKKIEPFIGPLKPSRYEINQLESYDVYRGGRYCRVVVITSVGSSAVFELNYTYKLMGFRNDVGTRRITRVYSIQAVQRFMLPEYNYTVLLRVSLSPLCESITNEDGTIEIPLGSNCVLRDKWGTEVLIP
jgi:hypothetical protein